MLSLTVPPFSLLLTSGKEKVIYQVGEQSKAKEQLKESTVAGRKQHRMERKGKQEWDYAIDMIREGNHCQL